MLVSNIRRVRHPGSSPRARATQARIQAAALDLFERDGYERTTTASIAAAAGVTPMTFFRHFPTKAAVVVSDPYDPLIAAAVASQPRRLPATERVRRAMLSSLATIGPAEDSTARRRVAVVASNPALRAAVVEASAATERAIVDQLVADGASAFEARVAAGACLGAATAALLAIAEAEGSLTDVITRALQILGPGEEEVP